MRAIGLLDLLELPQAIQRTIVGQAWQPATLHKLGAPNPTSESDRHSVCLAILHLLKVAMKRASAGLPHELGRFFGTAVMVRADVMALTMSRFTILVLLAIIGFVLIVSKRLFS